MVVFFLHFISLMALKMNNRRMEKSVSQHARDTWGRSGSGERGGHFFQNCWDPFDLLLLLPCQLRENLDDFSCFIYMAFQFILLPIEEY